MSFVHVDPNSKFGGAILVVGVPCFAVLLFFELIEFSGLG